MYDFSSTYRYCLHEKRLWRFLFKIVYWYTSLIWTQVGNVTFLWDYIWCHYRFLRFKDSLCVFFVLFYINCDYVWVDIPTVRNVRIMLTESHSLEALHPVDKADTNSYRLQQYWWLQYVCKLYLEIASSEGCTTSSRRGRLDVCLVGEK